MAKKAKSAKSVKSKKQAAKAVSGFSKNGKYLFMLLAALTVLAGTVTLWELLQVSDRESKAVVIESQNKTVLVGDQAFTVEVADETDEQLVGLSGRDMLEDKHGMLFVYSEAGQHGYWMKDMKFSVDIVWIGADKTVVDITPNLAPETYPQTFSPKTPAQYVLELPAGSAEKYSIQVGTPVSF